MQSLLGFSALFFFQHGLIRLYFQLDNYTYLYFYVVSLLINKKQNIKLKQFRSHSSLVLNNLIVESPKEGLSF